MMGVFMSVRVFPLMSLLLALAGPGFVTPAVAQSVPSGRVLVMPFSVDVQSDAPGGAGTSLWLGEAAAILIEEGLANMGVASFSREDRADAFDRLQLPMSSVLTRATMIRVGELIGASDIVFGEVRVGAQLGVRARIVRLPAGLEQAPVLDQAPVADIFALFKRVATNVETVTGAVRRPPGGAALAPLQLEAFENYVKGLVAATPAAQQRFLETASRLAPMDPRILLALWNVYTSQELHDRALAMANAVPADSAAGVKARFAVTQSLIALKRLDGAYQELTALYTKSPSAAVSNSLGIVQLRRGVSAAGGTGAATPATTFFARAVSEEPDNTTYLFNLGYAHALAQHSPEALSWLRETVRFDAADGDAHLVMSAVLAGGARTTEAQREFDLARSLGTSMETTATMVSSKIPTGLERMTVGLSTSGVSRVTVASPAQRDQQETAAYHLSRGRGLAAERKDREAIEEFRRAIYPSPYENEPHLLLGQAYYRAGRLTQAIDEFKVAIWSRDTAAAQVALGIALLDSGDRDGAKKAADRALVLAPTSVDARDLLKRIGG